MNRPSLDLHGRFTDEVFDLLDDFIMNNQQAEELCIVVGKGRGLIRKKTIEYLDLGKYPWSYEKINGRDNQGALIVDLT